MQIQEASIMSGLSIDTIRFYEKLGILPPIERDPSGHRRFTTENIEWMKVLYWLRKTGMPTKIMSRYAHSVHSGDHTIDERIKILRDHQVRLDEKQKELNACQDILDYKLSAYFQVKEGMKNEQD